MATVSINLAQTTCWCGTPFALPAELLGAAHKAGHTIYCPHGHKCTWADTEADKLRRERDRLAQRISEKDDEIRHQRERAEATERRLSAAKGQVTKIKNRVGHGVCPCCNRTFENLQRHMTSQHPTFAEAAE